MQGASSLIRPVPEPDGLRRQQLWRLDPAALDPQFPFERVRNGRRLRRGGWHFFLALAIGTVAALILIGSLRDGEAPSDVTTVGIVGLVFALLIAVMGLRASRNWQWQDKHSGQPIERTALRLVGDERVAFAVMDEISRQSSQGPIAWRPLTDGQPWKKKRYRARLRGVVIINVYAPARDLHPAQVAAPALVTARAVPTPGSGEPVPQVLAPQVVNLNWAYMVLAAALGTSYLGDGGSTSGGYSFNDDWKCDDGSTDGGDCSDTGDGGDGGDGGGDGGGGD